MQSEIVALKYYVTYAKAAGIVLFFAPISFYTVRQSLRMGSDFWLAEWMEVVQWLELHPNATEVTMLLQTMRMFTFLSQNFPDLPFYSYVYAGIQGVALIMEIMALTSARNLQASMLKNLLAAPKR
jgi:hypothetical protein